MTMHTEISDPQGYGYYDVSNSGVHGHIVETNSAPVETPPSGNSLPAAETHGPAETSGPVGETPEPTGETHGPAETPESIETQGPNNAVTPEDPTGKGESIGPPIDEPLDSSGVQRPESIYADNSNIYIDEKAGNAAGLVGGVAGVSALGATMNIIDEKRDKKNKKAGNLEIKKGKEKKKKANDLEKILKEKAGPEKLLRFSLDKITSSIPNKFAFWGEIKDKPFEIAELSKKKKIQKGMLKTVEEFQEIIGDEAQPKKDSNGKVTETVKEWLYRVAKRALEQNK
jgi:hypothetical protein